MQIVLNPKYKKKKFYEDNYEINNTWLSSKNYILSFYKFLKKEIHILNAAYKFK